MAVRLEVTMPLCLHNKAMRSVSKQSHLQSRCLSKATLQNRQLTHHFWRWKYHHWWLQVTSTSQEVCYVDQFRDTHFLSWCFEPNQNQQLWQVSFRRPRYCERQDPDEWYSFLTSISTERNTDDHCGCLPFTHGKHESILESGDDNLVRVKPPRGRLTSKEDGGASLKR